MNIKTRKEYTDANRVAWNQAASRHADHNNQALLEAFKKPGHVTLQGEILKTLLSVGVRDKKVIQLCCNNAIETLSLRNLGASYCVGVDAAEEFLADGQTFIEMAEAEDQVELINADVYALPKRLIGSFDLVVTTIGVIGWMPELEAFFDVIQSLLKPGGTLVMEETHPILLMYEPDSKGGLSSIQYSYFNSQVWEETEGLDYFSGETYESAPNFSFMHRLDQILMAGINNGLRLVSFKELDHDISLYCSDLEHSATKPPLGFVMVMEK